MSEHEQNELWEKSLRGRLTPGEEAQLRAHLAVRPELRAEWESELALMGAVRQMPDVPVSSNFTSLVMQAVAREEQLAQRTAVPASEGFVAWFRRHFAQLSATTAVVAVAGVLVVQQHKMNPGSPVAVDHRQDIAEQMRAIANVPPVPSVEVLKDFEAIRRMSQVQDSPEADLELLAVLAQ